MIPLAIPNLCGNEAKYLNQCIEDNFVSSVGPFVTKFEEEIKKVSGAKGCVAVNTGTAALHVALKAIGVQKDDLVILPTLTFIASANAIAYLDALPWLIDVSKDSWTLDPELLHSELKKNTKQTERGLVHIPTGKIVRCIMTVYTLGMISDTDRLKEIADEFNLPLVADGAAALGADYKGRPMASLAEFTCFSFNGNKTVTAGGGGAVVSNNSELLERIRHLSTTARKGFDYYHDEIGFNYRLTNIQAAVGLAQLENLDKFVKKKQEIQDYYDDNLKGIKYLSPFPRPDYGRGAAWFSGVVVDRSKDEVDKIISLLNDEGVMARPFWVPIHLQTCFKDAPTSLNGVAEKLWSKILVLPCSTGITNEELDLVIKAVKKVFSRLN